MLFLISDLLSHYYGYPLPAALFYYSTRMIFAAATSMLFCIAIGPYFIRKLYELKVGQRIRSDEVPYLGTLHQQKRDTPTMGGILILFSMVLSLFLYMDLSSPLTHILLLATLLLGGLGACDDYLKIKRRSSKGIPPKAKLAVQLIVGLILAFWMLAPDSIPVVSGIFTPPIVKEQQAVKAVLSAHPGQASTNETLLIVQKNLTMHDVATRIYIPFIQQPVFILSGVLGIFLALCWMCFVVVGSSNAVNLTDGLDGLAAGAILLVAGCFALLAFISNNVDLAGFLHLLYIEGSGEIAIYLSAVAGACLGFLWYNSHPAQVFMGDTGSLALGGVIGVSATLLGRTPLLGLVGGIFVVETLSVILQVASFKWRNKKRLFLCTPIHHHFEYKGWAENKVVVRFWIIGLLLALLGLASLKISQ